MHVAPWCSRVACREMKEETKTGACLQRRSKSVRHEVASLFYDVSFIGM
jgi:hypothetical protein